MILTINRISKLIRFRKIDTKTKLALKWIPNIIVIIIVVLLFRILNLFLTNNYYKEIYFQNVNVLNNNYVGLFVPSLGWMLQDRLINGFEGITTPLKTNEAFLSLYEKSLLISNTIRFDSLLISKEETGEFYDKINTKDNCPVLTDNEINCETYPEIADSLYFTYKIPILNIMSISKTTVKEIEKEMVTQKTDKEQETESKLPDLWKIEYISKLIDDLAGLVK